MAAVVQAGADVWVVVECDHAGCGRHVAGRPIPPMSAYDLLCCVFDDAADEGWLLEGRTYCPGHRELYERRRRGKRRTVGDGLDWVQVSRAGSPGQQRPS
jgi:hypothetical protein